MNVHEQLPVLQIQEIQYDQSESELRLQGPQEQQDTISDKRFLCGYVRDNRELFVPVRLGDPELEFKINGSADPDFIKKIDQMMYGGRDKFSAMWPTSFRARG